MIHHHFTVITASILVFLILNLIENYIHFSIGRGDTGEKHYTIQLSTPTRIDWLRIFVIMTIFAFLQAFFTKYLLRY
jgi:hypothetical protein